ncbi:MAG TPA: S46 family peptidase [Pyrinomonadaceae bacterium]|nr:S46 family peptidase [Pyrinomonadaceae bacterium]
MKKISVFLLLASFLVNVPLAIADEGMWTFDNPPLKQWKERYNFEPSAEWLEKVRLASVRLNDGGSGSFVSPDGLIITNQHVASGQLTKLSTKERDIVKNGFYAPTRDAELKTADLEVNMLVSYENVTERVQSAVKAGATDKDASAQRRAEIAAIEKESTDKTGLKSEVISLYNGGEYWLYRNKKYTDVRVVFAPEEQAAFFGGDYDNFTFPRHDLDITILRVYENGQPIKSPQYLKWSETGPKDEEFVIATGYPGSTARLLTVAQLAYQRDTGNPLQKKVWTSRLNALENYSKRGTEQARQATGSIRSFNNSLKRLTGQQDGLMNPRMFAKKEAEEKALKEGLAKNAALEKELAPAWKQISDAYTELPKYANRIAFSNLSASRLGTIASSIVRYGDEIKKPNNERYPEFNDARLESFKAGLLSPAPIYPEMEEALLTAWLEEAKKTLGANDPFIKAALGDAEVSEVVKRAVNETKLKDVAARKALLDNSDSIAASTDPMVTLARRVEPVIRELRAWNEEKITSVDARAGEKIAKARFAVYGRTIAPDANFNLRITFGKVKGYEEDTTLVPYKTTFFGLYDRAESFGEKTPYELPARFKERRDRLNLATPLNFVYSADTIGGMSGSPIINRNGEFVGINFDSNVQKLSNRYWYIEEEEGSRAVGVHSAGILEALRKLYDAENLANELTGK